jgi:hypothetical protein
MTERPSQRDLELDAIDEAHATAIHGMCSALTTYAKSVGVGPQTFEDAEKLCRGILADARKKRAAAISLVSEDVKT